MCWAGSWASTRPCWAGQVLSSQGSCSAASLLLTEGCGAPSAPRGVWDLTEQVLREVKLSSMSRSGVSCSACPWPVILHPCNEGRVCCPLPYCTPGIAAPAAGRNRWHYFDQHVGLSGGYVAARGIWFGVPSLSRGELQWGSDGQLG